MGEMQSQQRLGLIVGVPIEKQQGWDTGRVVAPEWAFTMANLVYPTGLNHVPMVVAGKRIDDARNEIIHKALELDCKYVFFLDDDVRVPANIILHLMPELDKDPNCIAVGGLYSPKRNPTEPMCYRKMSSGPSYDWKYGEVFEVEGIATGALLVKTELFKQIEEPWFKTTKESGEKGNVVYSRSQTDDLYFCDKAIAKGFTIKAHGGMLCDHIDAENHKIYHLRQFLPKVASVLPPTN